MIGFTRISHIYGALASVVCSFSTAQSHLDDSPVWNCAELCRMKGEFVETKTPGFPGLVVRSSSVDEVEVQGNVYLTKPGTFSQLSQLCRSLLAIKQSKPVDMVKIVEVAGDIRYVTLQPNKMIVRVDSTYARIHVNLYNSQEMEGALWRLVVAFSILNLISQEVREEGAIFRSPEGLPLIAEWTNSTKGWSSITMTPFPGGPNPFALPPPEDSNPFAPPPGGSN